MLTIDLNKSTESLKLSLQKAGAKTIPVAELAIAMDVSGSFDDEHRDGKTNDILTRLIPWGMTFDPNKQIDFYTFSSGMGRSQKCETVNLNNYQNYIQSKIIGKVNGYGGGTEYSYVLEDILKNFGWIKTGFFGFGAKEKKKSICILVTDGENTDKSRTKQILSDSQNRRDDVYFQFLGISNQYGKFPFLQEISDEFTNTGLVVVNDLNGFINSTDEQMNEKFVTKELIDWINR